MGCARAEHKMLIKQWSEDGLHDLVDESFGRLQCLNDRRKRKGWLHACKNTQQDFGGELKGQMRFFFKKNDAQSSE
jgi:hypothetical protein